MRNLRTEGNSEHRHGEYEFLDTIDVERARRIEGRVNPDPHAQVLWRQALKVTSRAESHRLGTAYDFAETIEYAHEGLSGAVYFAHPVRVAALSVLSQSPPSFECGVLGLLHNVLEVSAISKARLADEWGWSIAEQVNNLTVDRSQQWSVPYKASYYGRLNAGPLPARVVKVFDKVDNLFVLGLNPDPMVRDRYLSEIEAYVVPLAQSSVPAVVPYMRMLLEDVRARGYFGGDA
jgi:(p)ppGpp synthase/HD superfamily hydrolase